MISTLLLMSILAFPQVSVSIGTIESGMNVKAVGKCGEKGAYQVREKYWGKVPKTLKGQMKQHNDILLELLNANNHDINKAVISYNGKGTKAKKYLRNVVALTLQRVVIGIG